MEINLLLQKCKSWRTKAEHRHSTVVVLLDICCKREPNPYLLSRSGGPVFGALNVVTLSCISQLVSTY